MGRNTKEHTELVNKKVFTFLLERKECAARLKAVTNITESLLKCRNGERKKKYKQQLGNAHKVLCSLATDAAENRQKYRRLDVNYEKAMRKNRELSDENVELHEKVRKWDQLQETSETQKQMRFKAEEDCGLLLTENNKLREEIKKLKNQISEASS